MTSEIEDIEGFYVDCSGEPEHGKWKIMVYDAHDYTYWRLYDIYHVYIAMYKHRELRVSV